MKEVAKTVAKVYVGEGKEWSPKGEYYDQDSSLNGQSATNADSQLTSIVSANGVVDLPKFFMWLNTNRWFNGRDMLESQFPTLNGTDKLFSEYQGSSNPITSWTGTNPYKYIDKFESKNGFKSINIDAIIGKKDQGIDETQVYGDAGNLAYKYLVLGLSPSTIQSSNTITNNEQTNSISPEAAFVGSSHAISQYLQFKDISANHYAGMFKKTDLDFTLRTGTGGAAYASSGAGSTSWVDQAYGGFYLDSNPYFGLQKWSMSTLATHESITGHVFQFNYAANHPAVDYAPVFDSTAYAEGWGLFSEWLAVQVGMYGTPKVLASEQDNKLQLPNFGQNSKNIDVTQFKNKYEYANGAYWVGDEQNGSNSQVLFDTLQYFGFLNERQLRAMRCAVDVGIHAGGATIDQNGDVANPSTSGQYTKGSGWSLSEARGFYLKIQVLVLMI